MVTWVDWLARGRERQLPSSVKGFNNSVSRYFFTGIQLVTSYKLPYCITRKVEISVFD